MNTKLCRTCGETKPVDEFYKHKKAKDGLNWACKSCASKARKEWYRNNKEKVAADQAKWVEKNRERVKANQQRWREENREKIREYWKRWRNGTKAKVIAGYGGKCTCCGESELVFLTIDHVNNDGAIERSASDFGGDRIYRVILQEGFPGRYQILCYNCNMAKYRLGICPHSIDLPLSLGGLPGSEMTSDVGPQAHEGNPQNGVTPPQQGGGDGGDPQEGQS